MTDKSTDDTFRRAEDWERLAIIEVRVNDHEEDIRQLISHQQELSKSFESIVSTLKQVRTALLTAIAFFLLNEMGLLATIKALL